MQFSRRIKTSSIHPKKTTHWFYLAGTHPIDGSSILRAGRHVVEIEWCRLTLIDHAKQTIVLLLNLKIMTTHRIEKSQNASVPVHRQFVSFPASMEISEPSLRWLPSTYRTQQTCRIPIPLPWVYLLRCMSNSTHDPAAEVSFRTLWRVHSGQSSDELYRVSFSRSNEDPVEQGIECNTDLMEKHNNSPTD